MCFLKPAVCGPGLSHLFRDIFYTGAKIRVPGEAFQFLRGARLQNNPGIARQVPQFGVERPPDIVGPVVPGPAQIESYFDKLVEAREPFRFIGEDGLRHLTPPVMISNTCPYPLDLSFGLVASLPHRLLPGLTPDESSMFPVFPQRVCRVWAVIPPL